MVISDKQINQKPLEQGEPVKKHIYRTERVVQVEDDRTGMSVETLKRAFADNLFYIQGKDPLFATTYDYYMALSYTVRDRLIHRWMKIELEDYDQETAGLGISK